MALSLRTKGARCQQKLAPFAAPAYVGGEGESAMRKVLILSALLAAPALAQPPREQSPAPRDMLESLGTGNSDEAIAAAITAAAAHPLGSLQNPVRVAGPDGERAYLARLRCADGKAPTIGRAAPAGVGAYGTLVDAYPLDCGGAAPGKVNVAMDRYHEENPETRAPSGFLLTR
jgi:hypothetical protein